MILNSNSISVQVYNVAGDTYTIKGEWTRKGSVSKNNRSIAKAELKIHYDPGFDTSKRIRYQGEWEVVMVGEAGVFSSVDTVLYLQAVDKLDKSVEIQVKQSGQWVPFDTVPARVWEDTRKADLHSRSQGVQSFKKFKIAFIQAIHEKLRDYRVVYAGFTYSLTSLSMYNEQKYELILSGENYQREVLL